MTLNKDARTTPSARGRHQPPPAELQERLDRVTDRAVEAEQHFTAAAAALSPKRRIVKKHGRARHRPPVDLRFDARKRVAVSGEYVRIDKKRLDPCRTRAVSSLRSSRASSRNTSSSISRPTLEEKLDLRSRPARLEYKQVLRDFWKRLHGRRRRDKGSARRRTFSKRLNDAPWPAHLPGRRKMAPIRAQMPQVRARDASRSRSPASFGAFIGCGPTIPDCKYTRQLTVGAEREQAQVAIA
ncbi:hypothetical protein [Parvibaculum sp.]|uniref:hypothetical protein n=1 Tax=Parvibaculum sp. TaxID=2024848 RepID=UPI003BAB459C